MNNMNFTAHAGGDAETRYTQAGDPIVTVNIALKTGFGKKAKTHWSKLTIFGKHAEWLGEIQKGEMILVSGAQYEVDEWTTKDGEKRKTHSFIAGFGSEVTRIQLAPKNEVAHGTTDIPNTDIDPADDDNLPF